MSTVRGVSNQLDMISLNIERKTEVEIVKKCYNDAAKPRRVEWKTTQRNFINSSVCEMVSGLIFPSFVDTLGQSTVFQESSDDGWVSLLLVLLSDT